MTEDEILHLTLAGGKRLRVRKFNIIAAHEAMPAETIDEGETKIYLSSGVTMFIRESVEQAVRE